MSKILCKVLSSVKKKIDIIKFSLYSCAAYCTFEYTFYHFFDVSDGEGPCMEPTLPFHDVLLSEKFTPRYTKNFQRGQIVSAKYPLDPKQSICKRITGLPGDIMKVGSSIQVVVPVGHVWLEGDNSENSFDSRNFGPVPQRLITSRAVCCIWPIKDMKMLWKPFST